MEIPSTNQEEERVNVNHEMGTLDVPKQDISGSTYEFGSAKIPADIESWFRSIAQSRIGHATSSPPKSLGVSYQDLTVYGRRTSSDYHHTVSNYPLRLASFFDMWKRRNDSKVDILLGLDGIIRGGEMLLVLGRPGSGCSTFLKTLAGEMLGMELGTESKLNYNGITPSQMSKQYRGEYIYTAEHDHHFPELTVGETLEFAAACREPRHSRMDKSLRRTYASSMKEAFLSVFDLWGVKDSKLGNDVIRGVSGGERKRVSIAESLLSWAPFQCWDNSTRGLDSETALRFIQVLRTCVTSSEAAAAVSLYQASQAIYNTFDRVVVLYQGRQIYFGPIASAAAYFENLGYICPDNVATADFLTALTHPPEARSFLKQGYESRSPRCAEDFARLWHNSVERQRLLEEICAYNKEFALNSRYQKEFEIARVAEKAQSLGAKSAYTIPIAMQALLCIRREFQRLRHNLAVPISAAVGNVVMAIIIGSVFYNLEETTESFFSRGILIFFAVILNGCLGAFEVLTIWAQRPIVEKHNRYAFYHPFTSAAAAMVCDLPNKIITSICFNVAIYFITNLRRSVAAFFTWLLFSFACFLSMSMFFRMVGSLSRTLTATLAPVAITILMYITYAGFVIPASSMQPWLGWFRYINPFAFAFESLMINEGRIFPCKRFAPSGPSYANIPLSDKLCAVAGARPGELFVTGNDYLRIIFGYTGSHIWRNLGIITAMGIAFCSVHLVSSEYILTQKSKGDILQHLRSKQPKRNVVRIADNEMASHFSFKESPREAPALNLQAPSELEVGNNVPFYWDNLSFEVMVNKARRRILHNVEGWVKPRTLTALMGVTGAGKTTLLDVLADRTARGVVFGEVLINGYPRNAESQRKIGYVQQHDFHLATATVREALEFSALLRQSRHTKKQEKLNAVDNVIDLLEMGNLQDAIVGVPGQGLNVEQRRRLSIGVEMVAKPELLLFLDEPTSGLDSQTAWSICKLLRKLANNGQTILCTIHQPSARLFQEFDDILLLGSEGRTHYFGKATEMSSYFEKRGAPLCGLTQNPAEWVMHITGPTGGTSSQHDWAQLWQASEERKIIKDHLIELKRSMGGPHASSSPSSSSQFAVSFGRQLNIVTKRAFRDNWRTPTYIWSRFFLCVGSAFFIGFSFWDAPNSIQGLQNMLFSVFLLLMVFSQVVQQLIPQFLQSRTLYEAREGPSRIYDWKVFVISSIIVEIPWQTLMSILAFLTWYFPIGFRQEIPDQQERHERAGLICAFLWVFYLFCSTFATLVATIVNHSEMGVNLANLFYYLTLIFCGVLMRPSLLPKFWVFLYRASPLTYLISGMFSAGVAHKAILCSSTEFVKIPLPDQLDSFGIKPNCGAYLARFLTTNGGYVSNPGSTDSCLYCPVADTDSVLQTLGVYYQDRWRNFGLLWVYVVFNSLSALLLYWFARVPHKENRKKL